MTSTKTTQKEEKAPPVKLPELVDMLEAGVHFGHERSKRNPKMEKNIFLQRHRVAIIDLEKTQQALAEAVKFMNQFAQHSQRDVLFVGTKRQAREIVRHYAEEAEMPYVTKRWLGGTLTNFATIQKSVEKLAELKNRLADQELMAKLTKKEKAVMNKEIERLEEVLEGLMNVRALPGLILVVGAHDEKLAVREAKRVGIPVVGIADTNTNPELLDYAIPANDDAVRSIDLIVATLTNAILSARGGKEAKPAAIKAEKKDSQEQSPIEDEEDEEQE